MIKFFRRIRQKLLTDNKFSKYLLYAIGEIALVMVGILLALQVNNWNEERKESLEEKALLLELKREVKQNIKLLTHQKVQLKDIHNNFEMYFSYFQNPDNSFNMDSIAKMTTAFEYEQDYRPNLSTLGSTVETDRINLIKDEKLRQSLDIMHGAINNLESTNEIRRKLKSEKSKPVLFKYFYTRNIWSYRPDKLEKMRLNYTQNVGHFFSDIENQNIVAELIAYTNGEIYTADWVNEIFNDVLLLLDENLKKFGDVVEDPVYGLLKIGGEATGSAESIHLNASKLDKNLWQGTVNLNDGSLFFYDIGYSTFWNGIDFPKGKLVVNNPEFPDIVAKKGTYKVTVDLNNNTYEFIKVDD